MYFVLETVDITQFAVTVISGCRRGIAENCARMCHYTVHDMLRNDPEEHTVLKFSIDVV